jgi:LacI family transcriptional regulator
MAKLRKNMAQDVTMTDVAREAGVSVVTVSRVLNDHQYVAEQTRAHVQEVIKRLDYQPNAIARSLVSKQTRTIGLVTTDLSDYFFAQTISGAELEGARQNYFCFLGSTEGVEDKEPQYVRLFRERHVDGLFFVRPSTDLFDAQLLNLLEGEIPIVTVGYHLPLDNVYVIDIDNVDGGRQAVDYLTELGHRRIATITGPMTYKATRGRLLGYEQALASASIPFDRSLVVEDGWTYEGGYAAMKQLLARDVDFTALFAQSDEIAIGAIQALREANLVVPDDVSLVGYNNNPVVAYFNPSISSVHQPMRDVGRVGMEMLIRAIKGEKLERNEYLLRPELIRRASAIPLR